MYLLKDYFWPLVWPLVGIAVLVFGLSEGSGWVAVLGKLGTAIASGYLLAVVLQNEV